MKQILTIVLASMAAVSCGTLFAKERQIAATQLIAPEEASWFRKQPPASKPLIIADLRKARICIANYGKRDARKDALKTSMSRSPKFYTGISNGVVIYRTLPGVAGCSPPFSDGKSEGLFEELADAWSGPPRAMRLQTLCSQAASRYAAAFNRTLAVAKPNAFQAACPAGRLEP